MPYPCVYRDSATRWARRLAVQSDVGELFMFVAEKPARRYIFFGTTGALVGVSSSIFYLALQLLWLARRVHFSLEL